MIFDLGLIIPTYNMADHLPRLFSSLEVSGLLNRLREVLLVDDGSTDDTPRLLRDFSIRYPDKVRLVKLERNWGRFQARWEGAKASNCEKVLFLDTRLELESGFIETLELLLPKHDSIMGVVNIDTETSIFSLYWERTHRVLFRRHFDAAKRGFYLNAENFDRYLKGTTVFLCPRLDFIRACESFSGLEVLNDDAVLMRVIVENCPIWVDSRLGIRWWPRENTLDFLVRLWERGPSFVEYHIFIRRSGPMFWLVFMGLLFCLFGCFSALFFPIMTSMVVFGALIAMVLSTASFSRSTREFFVLMPLHVCVLLTFGFAILKGIILNFVRLFAGRFPRVSLLNGKRKVGSFSSENDV